MFHAFVYDRTPWGYELCVLKEANGLRLTMFMLLVVRSVTSMSVGRLTNVIGALVYSCFSC